MNTSLEEIETRRKNSSELANKISKSPSDYDYETDPQFTGRKFIEMETEINNDLPHDIKIKLNNIERLQAKLTGRVKTFLDVDDSIETIDWTKYPQQIYGKNSTAYIGSISDYIIIPFLGLDPNSFANLLLINEEYKHEMKKTITPLFEGTDVFKELKLQTCAQIYSTIIKNSDLLFLTPPNDLLLHSLEDELFTAGKSSTSTKEDIHNLLMKFARQTYLTDNNETKFTPLPKTNMDFPSVFKMSQANNFDNIGGDVVQSRVKSLDNMFNTKYMNTHELLNFSAYEGAAKPCGQCLGAHHPKDFHIFKFDFPVLLESITSSTGYNINLRPANHFKSAAPYHFINRYLPHMNTKLPIRNNNIGNNQGHNPGYRGGDKRHRNNNNFNNNYGNNGKRIQTQRGNQSYGQDREEEEKPPTKKVNNLEKPESESHIKQEQSSQDIYDSIING